MPAIKNSSYFFSTNTVATSVTSKIYGWKPQPDGRGTLDILLSCLVTVSLCSWSVLFLNVPAAGRSRLGYFAHKIQWMLFTVFFPEMITGIAAEQWRSAVQSVEDFAGLKTEWESATDTTVDPEKLAVLQTNLARLNKSKWTMRHAFFADMGGLHLRCPDFPAFPVDGFQIAWLLKRHYLVYPDISEGEIWDKNKADGFARAITISQITWFSIQCIGRWIQKIGLTTFELSTMAFIFCTLNTFFFWHHKPLDVETPIVLTCDIDLVHILSKEGKRVPTRYIQTPLDFVKPRTSRASLIAPFWFGMEVVYNWHRVVPYRPTKTFGNSKTTPPRGISVPDIIFALVFTSGYFAIHLIGWNFYFPTHIERMLWRIASLTLLGMLVLYLSAVAVGTVFAGTFAKRVFNNHTETTIIGVANLLPRWAAVLIHAPVIAVYAVARGYIIVEGFVNLRSMPASAFETVEWSSFLPHY